MTNEEQNNQLYSSKIDSAIDDCQNLLSLFKTERTNFLNCENSSNKVTVKATIQLLHKKKTLLDSFLLQQQELKELQVNFTDNNVNKVVNQKKLLTLTKLLEQLLIISNENEKTIRNEII